LPTLGDGRRRVRGVAERVDRDDAVVTGRRRSREAQLGDTGREMWAVSEDGCPDEAGHAIAAEDGRIARRAIFEDVAANVCSVLVEEALEVVASLLRTQRSTHRGQVSRPQIPAKGSYQPIALPPKAAQPRNDPAGDRLLIGHRGLPQTVDRVRDLEEHVVEVTSIKVSVLAV
jgi:hypothetical protein